jgi:glycosyltransferase involved in cell wall biosynthesis
VTDLLGCVGLITPKYSPAIGGVESCVENLARRLIVRSVDVEVITTDPQRNLEPNECLDGINVHRFPTIFKDDVYFLSPKMTKWLMDNARHYTLIHAHSYHTSIAFQASLVCQYFRIPFVVTTYYHGTGHTPFRKLLHLPYRFLGRRMLYTANQVICISKAEQDLISKNIGSAIPSVVIPIGVDIKPILNTRGKNKILGKKIILAVTRLEKYKQADRLVTVLPYLPIEFEVLIIGDGPTQNRLISSANKHNVLDRVHLLSGLTKSELIRWYHSADLFVSLSQKESFGIAVLEAAAAGLPVILSNIPAHKEIASFLPDNMVTFVNPDTNSIDLAQVIENVMHSTRLSIPEYSKFPTWEANLELTLACYKSALMQG